jgi:hypothetical protein
VLGVVVAGAAFADALANVTRVRAPAQALRVHPNDPLARAYAADRVFLAAPTDSRVRVTGERVAREALEGTLLNPVAIRLAAMHYEKAADGKRLLTALFAGQRLTRHDAATQLMLIEANVAQGNVVGALRGYDHVLRREPEMGETLFPILAGAARNPGVVPAMKALFGAGPPWAGYFIDWVTTKDDQLGSLLPVISAARPDASGLDTGRRQNLIKRLVELGDYPAAFTAYRRYEAMGAGSPGDFTRRSVLAPLDWEVQNGPGIDGMIDTGAGRFDFTILGDGRGMLLRRLIAVKPGRYWLDLAGAMNGPATARVEAHATCVATGRRLATVGLRPGTRGGMASADVPTDCLFAWLTLEGITTPQDAAEGRLSRLRLTSRTSKSGATSPIDQDRS